MAYLHGKVLSVSHSPTENFLHILLVYALINALLFKKKNVSVFLNLLLPLLVIFVVAVLVMEVCCSACHF